jgi:prepilin-type N-terminal cleavage/methylation domain-containing protein
MNKGYTLVEMLIAITILTIVTLGFFAWASTIIQTNLYTQKANIGYSIAKDIAEKLSKVSDNSPLIMPRSGNDKCAGFDPANGSLRRCTACGSGALGGTISQDPAGYTEFTDPWNNGLFYMYDNNSCENKTWLDTSCKNGITINPAANPSIDHPANNTDYDLIPPVRYENNTTYYAVWSIVYLSCTGAQERRKIFVTVYWIDPEPVDTTPGGVQAKLSAGTSTLKSVSIVVDRVVGIEK